MDPEQPNVMDGRYYYGQKAIIRNDEVNIQLHQTETSGHIRNAQPFVSRHMHSIGLEDVSASASHNNGLLGPISRNFQGCGIVNTSPSLSGRYEQPSHNNGLSNARDGSFEWNRQNYHGRQPYNFFGAERQRPVSFHGAFDFGRQPSNSFEFGRSPPNSFEFARQPPRLFETRGRNNIVSDVDDARSSNPSWYRQNYNSYERSRNSFEFGIPPPHSFDSGEQPTVSFENLSQGDSSDDNSVNERSKLIERIKKLYDEDTIKKNSARFEKKSWVKVTYLLSGGLKTYRAQMTCPVCLKSVSPYNRETELGRLPKWDLFAVKRHVLTLHRKKDDCNAKPKRRLNYPPTTKNRRRLLR